MQREHYNIFSTKSFGDFHLFEDEADFIFLFFNFFLFGNVFYLHYSRLRIQQNYYSFSKTFKVIKLVGWKMAI